MLVLNARFALLAAFSSLSIMTFSPRWGVGAAAIRSRPFGDHCQQVTSDRPSKQYVLPLPLQMKTVVSPSFCDDAVLLADIGSFDRERMNGYIPTL